MLFRAIKHTLYSIALSALVLTALAKLFSIHASGEAIADMIITGAFMAPLIVALNYILLPSAEKSHPSIDLPAPLPTEIETASACEAEMSSTAAAPAPRKKMGSGA